MSSTRPDIPEPCPCATRDSGTCATSAPPAAQVLSIPASLSGVTPYAGFFKALGHPVRLLLVRLLLDGERCVCELRADSNRDMSTISSHLNILRNAGIVRSEQRGKNIYYSLACPCLIPMLACLSRSPLPHP